MLRKQASLVLVVVILIGLAFSAYYTVKSGTVGVVATFGEFSSDVSMPGLHFKVPFVQKIYIFDVKMQTANYKGKQDQGAPKVSASTWDAPVGGAPLGRGAHRRGDEGKGGRDQRGHGQGQRRPAAPGIEAVHGQLRQPALVDPRRAGGGVREQVLADDGARAPLHLAAAQVPPRVGAGRDAHGHGQDADQGDGRRQAGQIQAKALGHGTLRA